MSIQYAVCGIKNKPIKWDSVEDKIQITHVLVGKQELIHS